MNKEKLNKYFKKLMEETAGDNTSNREIIDWQDGTSLTIDELEEEYYNYINILNDITDYIDDNELDDMNREDYKKIVKYAKESFNLSEDYFGIGQACLIEFIPYMIKKLNK